MSRASARTSRSASSRRCRSSWAAEPVARFTLTLSVTALKPPVRIDREVSGEEEVFDSRRELAERRAGEGLPCLELRARAHTPPLVGKCFNHFLVYVEQPEPAHSHKAVGVFLWSAVERNRAGREDLRCPLGGELDGISLSVRPTACGPAPSRNVWDQPGKGGLASNLRLDQKKPVGGPPSPLLPGLSFRSATRRPCAAEWRTPGRGDIMKTPRAISAFTPSAYDSTRVSIAAKVAARFGWEDMLRA